MANRRPQQNNGRRVDFGRNDRVKNFGRSGVSPWQGGGPGGGIPNLLPLGGGSTEATLALASNIINLLQPRQNPVPSLLDMPIRRDFVPNMGRFDRGFAPNRMGNQNFRRTGNYNRSGERVNHNRKPFRPNDGQRQQNKSSPKKEADSKAKPVKESEPEKEPKEVKEEPDKEKDNKEDKKEAPKTRYDDINPQLLKCHICNKSMWDGRSFENHLSGRAHAIMMQKTAESYALTADTMRQEFKIREMKRNRKTGAQVARDFYCAMCDMYAADGAAHRTTVGHRKLKKYLHPACTTCHKEMPTRIELDEHRLTAEHLRNMQDKQEVVIKPKPEVMVISTLSMEQSYVRDDRQPRRRRDTADKDKQEVEVKKESTEGDDKPDEVKKPVDSDDTVLDYNEGDDLTGVTSQQFPIYSSERGVGKSFLTAFQCVQCTLCRKLLDSDETAEVHLKTWRHHQLFLRMLNDKTGNQGKSEESNSDNKRPSNSDDSGTWKRRKTTTDDDDEAEENGHDEDVVMKEEPVSTSGDIDEPQGDSAMPAADELEDWENTIDDIINDETDTAAGNGDDDVQEVEAQEQDDEAVSAEGAGEGAGAGAEAETSAEPEVEPDTPAKSQNKPPVENKPKHTPRGRGRGRRRY